MEKSTTATSSREDSLPNPCPDGSERNSHPADAGQGERLYPHLEPFPDLPLLERETLRFWEENETFRRRKELNAGGPPWSFIDGPITANNPMGVHHAWGRTLKDVFQRFRSMRHHELRYQNGFDCQGLWVEVEVEKELGFGSKRDIETFGVAEFVRECKKRVLRYSARIVEQSRRLGYWMDWDDPAILDQLSRSLDLPNEEISLPGPAQPLRGTPEEIVGSLGSPELGGSYFTFSDENNYAIWRMLKKCHDNGWIYKGRDVVPWCPRCSTAISEHEISTEGYREIVHRSVYVKLPLRARPKESLLIWTTTPWTLTVNVAVAVNPDLTYCGIASSGQTIYIAEDRLPKIPGPRPRVLSRLKGGEMVGWEYSGPFDHLDAPRRAGLASAHRVIPWDEVSGDEGTGLVHIAPGCGKEDFELGQDLGLPAANPLDEDGSFLDGYAGLTKVSAADSAEWIVDDLESRGLLLASEDHSHRYPVCWRCGSEIVYRMVEEWFIAMDRPGPEGTLRESIIKSAREVRWVPEFGLQRELDWLTHMHDWMISKKRYWGLALPIWECSACGRFEVMGSREELQERTIEGWEALRGRSPHRPWIDGVKIRCRGCGSIANRVADVGSPWLDAGIVAYSTLGYFLNREEWARWFPAEMVVESLRGQFRNWFYAMLTMSTVLEGAAPFRVCLGHGDVRAEDGSEMHASLGNAIWFDDAVEKTGADPMRWLYCSTSLARDLPFSFGSIEAVVREVFMPLWNVLRFFVTYAEIDRWIPGDSRAVELAAVDRWILSRLGHATQAVTEALEKYDTKSATQALGELISDLSRIYLRSTRRRFWKNEASEDKDAAYWTLHRALMGTAVLLAPFSPFISEVVYQSLTRNVCPSSPESVHHSDWPEMDPSDLDEALEDAMDLARKVTETLRAIRTDAGTKLRQPLDSAAILGDADAIRSLEPLASLIRTEANVKRLVLGGSQLEGLTFRRLDGLRVGLNVEVSDELRTEGLAREIVRRVQKQRQRAGLEVDDRIHLAYYGDPTLMRALEEHSEYVKRETLSREMRRSPRPTGDHLQAHLIEGLEMVIAFTRSRR